MKWVTHAVEQPDITVRKKIFTRKTFGVSENGKSLWLHAVCNVPPKASENSAACIYLYKAFAKSPNPASPGRFGYVFFMASTKASAVGVAVTTRRGKAQVDT